MGMLEAGIMGLTTLAMVLAYVLIVPFGIMYVLEEVRGWRSGSRDPHLGAKLVSTLFLSITGQVALMGLAALLAGIVDDRIGGEMVQKNALALLFGGLAAAVLPFIVYRRVKDDAHPTIARQALGINAIIAAAVSTIALVSTFLVLFNEGKLAAIVVVDLVYTGAAFAFVRPLMSAKPGQKKAD